MTRKLYEFMNPEMGKFKLMESEDGKELFMQGLFIQGDIKNQNGRVYPGNEIERACNAIRERLKKGETVLGELDHPESPVVNLSNVSQV